MCPVTPQKTPSENGLFRTAAVQQGKTMEAVGCTIFSAG